MWVVRNLDLEALAMRSRVVSLLKSLMNFFLQGSISGCLLITTQCSNELNTAMYRSIVCMDTIQRSL